MSGSTIIFYLLAAFTLLSALLAVTTRMIFRAAIYLLFSLIGIAGIYFWLQYEFIAAVQIVVYVGGIVVLIIFSIFYFLINYSIPALIFESGLFKIFVNSLLSKTLCSNVCAILIASVGQAMIHKLHMVHSSR